MVGGGGKGPTAAEKKTYRQQMIEDGCEFRTIVEVRGDHLHLRTDVIGQPDSPQEGFVPNNRKKGSGQNVPRLELSDDFKTVRVQPQCTIACLDLTANLTRWCMQAFGRSLDKTPYLCCVQ